MKVSDYKLNPRWVCWLASRGEDPANQPEGTYDEPVYVVDPEDGQTYPRALVFMLWVQRAWREWGAELGFKRSHWGEANRTALASGHTHEEFDAWLRAKVGVEA